MHAKHPKINIALPHTVLKEQRIILFESLAKPPLQASKNEQKIHKIININPPLINLYYLILYSPRQNLFSYKKNQAFLNQNSFIYAGGI